MNKTDFIPETRICSSCLLLIPETEKKSNICVSCTKCKDVRNGKKNKLWKKQLDLFLNYETDSYKKNSDVIVMFSGGTDSTLALYVAKEELKLNVIALKFNLSWERSQINQKAEEFCLKYKIPLITIDLNLKSLFLSCHNNINKVNNKLLVNFPWCNMCLDFNWIIDMIARKLNTNKVITGNNFVFDNEQDLKDNDPNSFVGNFALKYQNWIWSMNVFCNINSNVLSINLPFALGFTEKKKNQKLLKIGHILPENYFRTPGSDCNLAMVLACSKKILNTGQEIPQAGCYWEYLSGYSTREEWLTELVKVNSFSKKDTKSALKYLRNTLSEYKPIDKDIIKFNKYFLKKFRNFDLNSFKNYLINEIEINKYLFKSSYFLALGKTKDAKKEANNAININPKSLKTYHSVAKIFSFRKKFSEILFFFQKAFKNIPDNDLVCFCLAETYFKLKKYKKAIKLFSKIKDLKEQNVHLFLGICYEKIKNYKKAISNYLLAKNIDQDHPSIISGLIRCHKKKKKTFNIV